MRLIALYVFLKHPESVSMKIHTAVLSAHWGSRTLEHATSTSPMQSCSQMHIFLRDDAVCRGHTQIRFLCTHEHTVLRRICTYHGLRRLNPPVRYTIVYTFECIYFLPRRYKIILIITNTHLSANKKYIWSRSTSDSPRTRTI